MFSNYKIYRFTFKRINYYVFGHTIYWKFDKVYIYYSFMKINISIELLTT